MLTFRHLKSLYLISVVKKYIHTPGKKIILMRTLFYDAHTLRF